MRYILRNEKKIEKAYDKIMLHRINASLRDHFDKAKELDLVRCHGDDYETLIINDIDHTVNVIAFFIISKRFDVYTLEFKEFIG